MTLVIINPELAWDEFKEGQYDQVEWSATTESIARSERIHPGRSVVYCPNPCPLRAKIKYPKELTNA